MTSVATRTGPPYRRKTPLRARRKPVWLRRGRTGGDAPPALPAVEKRVIFPFLLLIFLAFTIRGVTATRLIPHVDEAATLLATEMVETRGVPIFPSGVLYLQGASLTYLLTPLASLIGDTVEQLTVLRFVNVAMGTAVALLTALLAARIAGSWVPGLIAGLIVAFDPASIAWSVYLRPYAALVLVSIALVTVFIGMVLDGPARRGFWRDPVLAMVGLFLIGTFTHVGIWLLYPAIWLVAVLTWGTGLLGAQRRVTIGLLASLIAPLLFLVINSSIGPGSSTSGEAGGPSFVGSHLLTLERLLDPTIRLRIWTSLFHGSGLGAVMPLVLTAASGLLLGRLVEAGGRERPRERRAFRALLLLYWIPVAIAIGFIGAGAQYRYIIHVVPLGAIIVALAAFAIVRDLNLSRPRTWMIFPAAGVVALLVPVFFYGVIATGWRANDRGNDADYFAALSYVSDHYAPGQPIIVSLPPVAYVSLDDRPRQDVHFLAGPSDNARVGRYTKRLASGALVDFWLGGDAIGSTEGLCRLMATSPQSSWIVIDDDRLDGPYQGTMATVIKGSTTLVARGDGGVEVRSSVPVPQWSTLAVEACVGDSMMPQPPNVEEFSEADQGA
ncbi:MAG: hypothetical protein H0W06_08730 [Chloroflexia bacterium]|nr:hypothetical protein [Chloroflexia bacterium]